MMLSVTLLEVLNTAVTEVASQWEPVQTLRQDGQWQPYLEQNLRLERPKQAHYGDYAVNVSFLARVAKQAPPLIAAAVAQQLNSSQSAPCQAEAVAGFVNLRLKPAFFLEALCACLRQEDPGVNDSLLGQHIHLEYVSANPTGPLHVGHGRWAALGDSLRRIYIRNGAQVTTEFYVNNVGVQMHNMANSLWFRCLERLGLGQMPQAPEGEKSPYYPGEYVLDLADSFLAQAGQKERIESLSARYGSQPLPSEEPDLLVLRQTAQEAMLALQQQLLKRLDVAFDVWTLESSLHQQGLVKETLDKLRAGGFAYEKEGAVWLASSRFGDEKDRVLVKQDGTYTYLTADIAYHDFKYSHDYSRIINIWGADHHGYIARLKAAIIALGHDGERFEVILGQLVNLLVDGQQTRMGKRSNMLTLEDVVDEVGVDATRFWLVSRSADTTIDFDMSVAASASQDNPVFYAQYAHARVCSILRNATEAAADVWSTTNHTTAESSEAQQQGLIQQDALEAYWQSATAAELEQDLWQPLAENPKAQESVKALILLLDSFVDRVRDAGRLAAPHLLARYALDLATAFHGLYGQCRMLTDNPLHTMGRLTLLRAFQRVLQADLELLGVSAPEQM